MRQLVVWTLALSSCAGIIILMLGVGLFINGKITLSEGPFQSLGLALFGLALTVLSIILTIKWSKL